MNSTEKRDADSFHEVLDYRIVTREDGFVRLEMTAYDCHRQRGRFIHGGVLMSLMDIAGIHAGLRAAGEARDGVTVSLNCNFLAVAKSARVFAEGRLLRKGRSMFFSECRVIDAETDNLLATAQGVFKYL